MFKKETTAKPVEISLSLNGICLRTFDFVLSNSSFDDLDNALTKSSTLLVISFILYMFQSTKTYLLNERKRSKGTQPSTSS